MTAEGHPGPESFMIRLVHASLVLAAVMLLAACSGGTELARDVAMASGLTGGEPKPAPDFVSRSRAAETDYIATGMPAPRAQLRKNAKEVSSAESEMEALRKRNEARGSAARKAASP